MRRSLLLCWSVLFLACAPPEPALQGEIGAKSAGLTDPAARRTRAGQIRDAAAANGMTQGWLLAGIADAETYMSHCWSELTWACKGPNSSDCGGGPVVAGAGDGPCSLRQGGLGMFQFDAGTFDQTLAREGNRILSIAGNVAAGVDFAVGMVIRSTYISGVGNRAEAIAWMNGVRIGNGRWSPWVKTVTHYYNGCLPSYGCWSERYARYRDHTVDVYNEMGADFWTLERDYAADYVHQSFPLASQPFELFPGQERTGYLEMRNVGEATWRPGETFLGTTEPRDGDSPLAGPDWVNPHRAATIDHDVAPNETGRFNFTVRAPTEPGEYSQFFNLVQEGEAWFSQQGGPPDNQIQLRVTVVEPPACPAGTSETWSCDGDERVRCHWGEVTREPCERGCADGACLGAPADGDGDGADATTDCDDANPAIHPGAAEVCGDGIDQSCDGFDTMCGGGMVAVDGGTGGGTSDAAPPGADGGVGGKAVLNGGCSAAPGRGGAGALALLALAGLALVRRRPR